MPDILAFKAGYLIRYLSNISLSTEGIYGIPLGVSSSIVYLVDAARGAFGQGGGRCFAPTD